MGLNKRHYVLLDSRLRGNDGKCVANSVKINNGQLEMNTSTDPQELARCFNEHEAVWRAFEQKRELRRLLGSRESFSEKAIDDLDWAEAERECREVHCVGKLMP